jgi:hypothetical protein
MAVYKIFPTQDATLYSSYPTMNTGLDAILEASNKIDISGNPDVARYLVKFDTAEIIDIISNKISGSTYDIYFKNFIAEAQGINLDTSLEILPVAQNWNNGTGYTLDSPIVENGSSWAYSSYSGSNPWSMSGTGFTGSYNATYSSQGGGNFFTGSIYRVTQSFELRSEKDIEVNVKTTVNAWSSSILPNYGFIVKLTGSQEFNPSEYIQPQFKYYSVDTNTIYPPLYPNRVYQTSSLFTNLNYLPTSSYYAIKDLATNEFVINFDNQYTQISSDTTGNYFSVYMSGLEPERYYKILIKTIINNSTLIFDDNYYFKVING